MRRFGAGGVSLCTKDKAVKSGRNLFGTGDVGDGVLTLGAQNWNFYRPHSKRSSSDKLGPDSGPGRGGGL